MLIPPEMPSEGALIAELTTVRDEGLPRLRRLTLPALANAARIVTLDDSSPEYVVVESLLRRAATRLGGGRYGEAAVALLGLDAGTRGLNSRERRELAAEAFERKYETFRKNQEPLLFEQLTTQILILCSEQHARDTRSAAERRHPADSAMALHWIERFQAYYRIWTPLSGLANDLTAYRSTLLEEERPYDRRFGTQGPDDRGYSQDDQAEGYARDALYHYARFEWELRKFVSRYGGLWMLSDTEAEQAVAGAVYRISWHVNPFNERDQSFLRTLIDETPNHELHGFLQHLVATEIGQATHQEWQDWVSTCACTWTPSTTRDTDYFPTHRNQPGITEDCQVHQVIEACGTYLDLIDGDWKRIADWYHFGDEAQRGVNAERIYAEWRSTPTGRAYRAPN